MAYILSTSGETETIFPTILSSYVNEFSFEYKSEYLGSNVFVSPLTGALSYTGTSAGINYVTVKGSNSGGQFLNNVALVSPLQISSNPVDPGSKYSFINNEIGYGDSDVFSTQMEVLFENGAAFDEGGYFTFTPITPLNFFSGTSVTTNRINNTNYLVSSIILSFDIVAQSFSAEPPVKISFNLQDVTDTQYFDSKVFLREGNTISEPTVTKEGYNPITKSGIISFQKDTFTSEVSSVAVGLAVVNYTPYEVYSGKTINESASAFVDNTESKKLTVYLDTDNVKKVITDEDEKLIFWTQTRQQDLRSPTQFRRNFYADTLGTPLVQSDLNDLVTIGLEFGNFFTYKGWFVQINREAFLPYSKQQQIPARQIIPVKYATNPTDLCYKEPTNLFVFNDKVTGTTRAEVAGVREFNFSNLEKGVPLVSSLELKPVPYFLSYPIIPGSKKVNSGWYKLINPIVNPSNKPICCGFEVGDIFEVDVDGKIVSENPGICPTPTPTPTQTQTPTLTPTLTPSSTKTPTPTQTKTPTLTPTTTKTPTLTPTQTVSQTPTITSTPTITPSPTRTPGLSPTRTPTRTPTKTPTRTPTPTKRTICIDCESQYNWSIYSENCCVRTEATDAIFPQTLTLLSPQKNAIYSDFGTKINNFGFNVNGIGNVLYTLTTQNVWRRTQNGTALDGPLNRCGLWGDTIPENIWAGFTFCINNPSSLPKTYYVGIAADNDFKLVIDGTTVLNTINGPLDGNLDAFAWWNVYPITLGPGNHTAILLGLNASNVASFGCEIYDNTLQQLVLATSYSSLNVIFTSSGKTVAPIVQTVNGESTPSGFFCPTGYNLSTCGSVKCVKYTYCCVPPSPSPTRTQTPTPTKTQTPTKSPTPTKTQTPSVTKTSTPTITPTRTQTPTVSLTPNPIVYSCPTTFSVRITQPGITIFDSIVDLKQGWGNIKVTVSSTSFNQSNEIFVGTLDTKYGEIFTFNSGSGSQTKTFGFNSDGSTSTLDIGVFSDGSNTTPFVPFTINFTVDCPTTYLCGDRTPTPTPTLTPTPTVTSNIGYCYTYTIKGNSIDTITYIKCDGTTGSISIAGGQTSNLNGACIRKGQIYGTNSTSFTIISSGDTFCSTYFDPTSTGPCFVGGFNGEVWDMAQYSTTKFYAGGSFTQFNQSTTNKIARVFIDGTIDPTFNTGLGFEETDTNTAVHSLAVQNDGKVICGGRFIFYQGSSYNNIIRLNVDGSIDTSFIVGSGFNHQTEVVSIYGLAIQSDGKIICVGNFTSYNGLSYNNIIRLNSNGSVDTSFVVGTGLDGPGYHVAIQSDGKIIVVGGFLYYNGIQKNRILRINTNGSVDTTFVGGGFSVYQTQNGKGIKILPDGKIMLMGNFYQYDVFSVSNLIRINSNGSIDNTFTPYFGTTSLRFYVGDLIVQNDGKYVFGGQFINYNGTVVNGIVGVNTDGSINNSFSSGVGIPFVQVQKGISRILQLSDGKIIIAGLFSKYDNVNVGNITQLNANGNISLCPKPALTQTPTPTKTPTLTPTKQTPTPTMTKTPTMTPTRVKYTINAKINVTREGYISYDKKDVGFTKLYVRPGVVTLTDCLDCSTITSSIKAIPTARFTIIDCGVPCVEPLTYEVRSGCSNKFSETFYVKGKNIPEIGKFYDFKISSSQYEFQCWEIIGTTDKPADVIDVVFGEPFNTPCCIIQVKQINLLRNNSCGFLGILYVKVGANIVLDRKATVNTTFRVRIYLGRDETINGVKTCVPNGDYEDITVAIPAGSNVSDYSVCGGNAKVGKNIVPCSACILSVSNNTVSADNFYCPFELYQSTDPSTACTSTNKINLYSSDGDKIVLGSSLWLDQEKTETPPRFCYYNNRKTGEIYEMYKENPNPITSLCTNVVIDVHKCNEGILRLYGRLTSPGFVRLDYYVDGKPAVFNPYNDIRSTTCSYLGELWLPIGSTVTFGANTGLSNQYYRIYNRVNSVVCPPVGESQIINCKTQPYKVIKGITNISFTINVSEPICIGKN